MSAFIATRLSTVSSSVSPLLVDDTPMLRLITSAESRLAAISKVVRVRVEFSKNRLKTERPRSSGTFFTSRSEIDANGTAVSRMPTITSAGRSSSVSRWVSRPSASSCGLRTTALPGRLGRKSQTAVGRARQHDRYVTRDCETRTGVGCLDRQLASATVDQHGELDHRGSSVVEQLVHCGANAAARVEHVVDQHDRRAAD